METGFPLIEIDETGAFTVTKVEGSGGLVSVDTCKEQMIYEIHNPKAYLTPDATADFSKVTFRQIGENQVRAEHATTHGRPETLKVSVGYKDCFIGEGEISYGGSNCMARAELAAEILEKRIELTGIELEEYRTDFIGCNSLYRDAISKEIGSGTPCEVRLRAAGRTKDRKNAVLLANEVEALYTNGPAGGGGAVKRVSEIVSVCSIFVPRDAVEAKLHSGRYKAMKLKEIAHARTGDKGEISNISVIPYDENNYEMLKEKVTEARVAEYFREICHGKVTRYELDGIHALNFVLDKTLGGGVTRSLALDKHGKTLGMALLEMEV